MSRWRRQQRKRARRWAPLMALLRRRLQPTLAEKIQDALVLHAHKSDPSDQEAALAAMQRGVIPFDQVRYGVLQREITQRRFLAGLDYISLFRARL